jgi:hypothetical protein
LALVAELDPFSMQVVKDVRVGRSVDRPVDVGEGDMHLDGSAVALEKSSEPQSEQNPRGVFGGLVSCSCSGPIFRG